MTFVISENRMSKMSQLMRLWYLSHRWPAKAQASLRICAVSPEPSLFAHMKYGSRRRVRPKIRHQAPLDGCACMFEELVYGGRKEPLSHELAQMITKKKKIVWKKKRGCQSWIVHHDLCTLEDFLILSFRVSFSVTVCLPKPIKTI